MKAKNNSASISKSYLISVTALTIALPLLSFIADHLIAETALTFEQFGKWFIFYAVGLRLFISGVKQSTNPAFTSKEIFHIENSASYPIVRELGFANICFGLMGIISLFLPDWRIVSAFASGIYYGLATLLHFIKKPVSKNEQFAMWTDFLVFAVLLIYFIWAI